MKLRKIIYWNFVVGLALLFLLNLVCWFILDFKESEFVKRRGLLPSAIDQNYSAIEKEWFSLETDYQPFVGWQRKPFEGKYIQVGNNRKRVTPQRSPSTNKVIHFFGGSTMWGGRVAPNHTIPSWFAQCNAEYQIMNQGETGYNSRQNLAEFINILTLGETPDIVVFYDGVNDLQLCNSNLNIPGHLREGQFREFLTTKKSSQNYFLQKGTVFHHACQLINLLFFKHIVKLSQKVGKKIKPSQEPYFPYTCHLDEERANTVANNLLSNWKIAHELAESRGAKFIGILQPNVYTGTARRDFLTLEPSGVEEENYRVVYKILREKVRNNNWMFDLNDILNNTNQPLYYDFCHLNGDGNKIIANEICNIINEVTLQSSPSYAE